MITWPADIPILVSTQRVDMRKSIDGLCGLIVEELKQHPQDKQLFVFCNKARDKVKMIYWDRNGFFLLYKRLEQGRFKFPRQSDTETMVIDAKQWQWLLAGFDFIKMAEYPELDFTNFS